MSRTSTILTMALCAALNVALGSIVYLLKLPVYLDMVGTMLCALLFADQPRRAFAFSATVGVVSFVVGGILVNPFLPWFSATVVVVAAVSSFLTGRIAPLLRRSSAGVHSLPIVGRIVVYGVLTGIVAAIVSAPVVVYLFGGVTGSGSAMLVAFFLKTGHQLLQAALLSGLTAEPIDKTLQLFVAVALFRATPTSFLNLVREADDAR